MKTCVFVGSNPTAGRMGMAFPYTDMMVTEITHNNRNVMPYLEKEKPDLVFLLWWPYIIKKEILDLASVGFVNMHPSMLPHCRGKDPYFWSIVKNAPFGLTIHFVDEGIDTGDILFQKQILYGALDTEQSLWKKATDLAPQFLADKFDDIVNGNYTRTKQDLSEGSFHFKREKEEWMKLV